MTMNGFCKKKNLQRRWQKVEKIKILSCKVNFSKYFLPLFFKMMLIKITFKDFYISEEDLIGREICKCFQCLPCLDCTVSRRTEIILILKKVFHIAFTRNSIEIYGEVITYFFCLRTRRTHVIADFIVSFDLFGAKKFRHFNL